jgi:signal transduction histidine kinase
LRPALVWTLFGLCLVVVLVAMGWSSAIVLRLERAETVAQAQAALEENARLALWRMDSTLTPLLARESARPYFQYRSFYPAERAYSNMFAEPATGNLLPSPLLRETPSTVILHFQLAPRGQVTSPQVPEGPLWELAASRGLVAPASLTRGTQRLAELRLVIGETSLLEEAAREQPPPARPERATPVVPPLEASSQKLKSIKEFQARQQTSSQANAPTREPATVPAAVNEPERDVEEGAFAPLWTRGSLLLVRRVRVDGATYIQGCWLDWPALEAELLGSIRDLLPGARLEPVDPSAGVMSDEERRLATLPLRLLPGAPPLPSEPRRSPVRLSLVGAWFGLLLGALAVAALLQGVMALSERRREFVSAVSHELRTPLTTFRLYADMLAGGMVAGEEKRQEYLARLRLEAQRLSHLVENVLFYSRLESGRSGAVRESINLSVFLKERIRPLAERAEREGLTLAVDDATEGTAEVRVDASALEQILQNLVDNSCKYAARSEPSTIDIRLERKGSSALLRVRDHGPGLSATDRRRLFRPFSKSDREAALSAPGVGLGLALSRRLARAQGGDLRLDDTVTSGAAFVVELPLSHAASLQA